MIEALAALTGFAVTLGGVAVLVRRGVTGRALGLAEERWRMDSVPRLGGLAMLAGFLLGATLLALGGVVDSRQTAGFLIGAGAIAAVGVWDDLRGLAPIQKLVAQIMAASILVGTGSVIEIIGNAPLAAALTLFWVIAITNAMNLLDNMDGLAGGVGLVAVSLLAAHAAIGGAGEPLAIAALLGAVLLGFIPFNLRLRRRAAIFMGDGGSHLLGFALAWLALAASWDEASTAVAAIAIPLLVLAIPILDTTLVSVVRLLEGRRISEGGRDHSSHRLVLYGLTEKRAVALLIGTSAVVGASSLLYVEYQSLSAVIVGGGLALAALAHFGMFLGKGRAAGPESVEPLSERRWLSLYTYRFHKRRFAEALIDLVLILAAYYLAYALRYDRLPNEADADLIVQSLPVLIVARYAALLFFRLYRGLWRYAGIRDVKNALLAIGASEVAVVACLTLLFRFEGYSRSLFVINALLCFLFIAGSRLAERSIGELLEAQCDRKGLSRALIIGAGDAGNALLRRLRAEGRHLVVGFLDDDPAKRGMRAQGAPVLGDHRAIETVLGRHRPDIVYVTIPDAPKERLARIESACRRFDVRYAVVQGYGLMADLPAPTGQAAEAWRGAAVQGDGVASAGTSPVP